MKKESRKVWVFIEQADGQIASVSHSDRVGRGSRVSVSKLKIDELRNATCSHKGDQYDRRRLSNAPHIPGGRVG